MSYSKVNPQDNLHVIFLSVIAVIFSGIVSVQGRLECSVWLPGLVFSLITAWIMYENISFDYRDDRAKCTGGSDTNLVVVSQEELEEELEEELTNINKEAHYDTGNDTSNDTGNDKGEQVFEQVLKKLKDNDLKYDQTSEREWKTQYSSMGCSGDNALANRMKYMGIQPQLSQTIRASYNKYLLQPYLEAELKEHSEREWWSSDHLEDEF